MEHLPFSASELPNDIPAPANPIPFTLVNSQPLDSKFLAPYVPINHNVAKEALLYANLTSNDTLGDLGCGDARILAKALELIPCLKCIAVELDPYLIQYIRTTYTEWIKNGSLIVIEQNFMDTILSDITCLILYLLPGALSKLESKLRQWIQIDGNRMITITFSIPGWNPVKGAQVSGNSSEFMAGAHNMQHWIYYYDKTSI